MSGWKKRKLTLFQPKGNFARKNPNYDATCFFAQQCIEKCIKARLQEAEIEFGKIHDLVKLLELVSPVEALWDLYRPTFRPISAYAVNFRYPVSLRIKKKLPMF